jgi:3-keto-5-aminohexanoate cleavage enzyme
VLSDGLPPGTTWAAGGLGAFQLPMNAMAIFMGGHVRTGLEDNPALDAERRLPATNAALVARVVELAQIAGRPVAGASEVRAALGLRPAPVAPP